MNKLVKSIIYEESLLNVRYWLSKCGHVLLCRFKNANECLTFKCIVCKHDTIISIIDINVNKIKHIKIFNSYQKIYTKTFKNMLSLKLFVIQAYYSVYYYNYYKFVLCYKKIFKNKYIVCKTSYTTKQKVYFLKNKIIFVL